MTKNEQEKLEKLYQSAMDLLGEVMQMQRVIASKQIDILTKLRRLDSLGFVKMSEDIAVKHVVKFSPGKCQKCGCLIEGAYEYLRSQRDLALCIGCDGTEGIKQEESLDYKAKKQV